ncbi:hypothetical protein SS50377_20080 [Spironucleus salmonicida]|uniref:Uncharacterized protein n=1 Tax=Spironucleus salmonicida TaxID=348837 RepID=V6M008_9EUKA|nr:hypothetical protein SS50377_20080 [Spironucleus salmonicida]|eukprot:EST49351.1 hypothetical protein SS50377_10276 [Spironucleus salmonicida]
MSRKIKKQVTTSDPYQITQLSTFLEKEQQRYEDILASNCILRQGRSLLQHNRFNNFFTHQKRIRKLILQDTFNSIYQERQIQHNLRLIFCQPILQAWKKSTRDVLEAIKYQNQQLLLKSYKAWNIENILYIPNYDKYYKQKVIEFQSKIYREVMQGFIQFIKLRIRFLKGIYAGYKWKSVFKSIEQQYSPMPPFQRFQQWFVHIQLQSKIIKQRSQLIMTVGPAFLSWFSLTWQNHRSTIINKFALRNQLLLYGQYFHAWVIHKRMQKEYLQKYITIWKNFIGLTVEKKIHKHYLNKFEVRHSISQAFHRWKKYIFVQDMVLKSKYLKGIYGEHSVLNQSILDVRLIHPRANIAIAFIGSYCEQYKPFSTAVKCLFQWKQLPKQRKSFNRFFLLVYGVFNVFKSRILLRYWIQQHKLIEQINFAELENQLFHEFASLELLKSIIDIVRCSPGHALLQLRNNEKIEIENFALIHKYKRLILTLDDDEVNESVSAIFKKNNVHNFILFFWKVVFKLLTAQYKSLEPNVKIFQLNKVNEDKANENFKVQAKQQEKNMSKRYANFIGEIEIHFSNLFSNEHKYSTDLLKLFQKNQLLTKYIQQNSQNGFNILAQSLLTSINNFLLTSNVQLQSTTFKIGQYFEGTDSNIIIPQSMFSNFILYNTHGTNSLIKKEEERAKQTKMAIQAEIFRNRFPKKQIFKLSNDITNWLIGSLAYCNNKEYQLVYQTRNNMLKSLYSNIQRHYQYQTCILTWQQLGQNDDEDNDQTQVQMSANRFQTVDARTQQYVQEAIDYDINKEDLIIRELLDRQKLSGADINFGPMISRQKKDRQQLKIKPDSKLNEKQQSSIQGQNKKPAQNQQTKIQEQLKQSGYSLGEIKNIMNEVKQSNSKDHLNALLQKYKDRNKATIEVDQEYLDELEQNNKQNQNIPSKITVSQKQDIKHPKQKISQKQAIKKENSRLTNISNEIQDVQITKKQLEIDIQEDQNSSRLKNKIKLQKQKLPQILSNKLQEISNLVQSGLTQEQAEAQYQTSIDYQNQQATQIQSTQSTKYAISKQNENPNPLQNQSKPQDKNNSSTKNQKNGNQSNINNELTKLNNIKEQIIANLVRNGISKEQAEKLSSNLGQKLLQQNLNSAQTLNQQEIDSYVQQLINQGFSKDQAIRLVFNGIKPEDIIKLFKNGINPQQSDSYFQQVLQWKQESNQEKQVEQYQKFIIDMINQGFTKDQAELILLESKKQVQSGAESFEIKSVRSNSEQEQLIEKLSDSQFTFEQIEKIKQSGMSVQDIESLILQKQKTGDVNSMLDRSIELTVKQHLELLNFNNEFINKFIASSNNKDSVANLISKIITTKLETDQAAYLYEYMISNDIKDHNLLKQLGEIITQDTLLAHIMSNNIPKDNVIQLFQDRQLLSTIYTIVLGSTSLQDLNQTVQQQKRKKYQASLNQFVFKSTKELSTNIKLNKRVERHLDKVNDRLICQSTDFDHEQYFKLDQVQQKCQNKQLLLDTRRENSIISNTSLNSLLFLDEQDIKLDQKTKSNQLTLGIKSFDRRYKRVVSAPLYYFNQQKILQGILLCPFSARCINRNQNSDNQKHGQLLQLNSTQLQLNRSLCISEHSCSFIYNELQVDSFSQKSSKNQGRQPQTKRNVLQSNQLDSSIRNQIQFTNNQLQQQSQSGKRINIRINKQDSDQSVQNEEQLSNSFVTTPKTNTQKHTLVNDFDKLFSKIGVSKLQDIVAQRHNQLLQALNNQTQDDNFTKRLANLANQNQSVVNNLSKSQHDHSSNDLTLAQNIEKLQFNQTQLSNQLNNIADYKQIVSQGKVEIADDILKMLNKTIIKGSQIIINKQTIEEQNVIGFRQCALPQAQKIKPTAHLASNHKQLTYTPFPTQFRPLMTIQSGSKQSQQSYIARVIGPVPESASQISMEAVFKEIADQKDQQIKNLKQNSQFLQ